LKFFLRPANLRPLKKFLEFKLVAKKTKTGTAILPDKNGVFFGRNLQKSKVTAQHKLRWLHQKAGLSRLGPAGCLTELGIVHQRVARQ
jgi:hypothetical protein